MSDASAPAATIKRARVLGLGLGIAALATIPRRAGADEALIRVGCSTAATTMEAFYAQEFGMFKRFGLNVDVAQPSNSGAAPVVAGVLSGSLDIGTTTPIQLAVAFSKGIPLTMIASGAVSVAEAPIVALAVAKTSPIRDARDLSGKTIACTNLVDISILGVYAWLSKNGVPVDSVKVIELPFSTMAAALNRGTVDAAVLAEPALSAGRDQVRLLPEVFATVGKRWLVTCWFGKTDYVRANADAMKRYARAIYAAGKYANARPAQTAPILAAKSNMTAASIGAMTPIIFTEQVDERDIQPELDLAYKFKLIERPITYAELAGK